MRNPYYCRSPSGCIFRGKGRLCAVFQRIVIGGILLATKGYSESLIIQNTHAGTTPAKLGYNLGHFADGSNAADWFRYSGARAARIFISVADIEPSDDISPIGDGVNSEASFLNRRSLLRADAASTTTTLSNTYVNWSYFTGRYSTTASGNNRIRMNYALGNLRDRGVSVLANLTASPGRFPISDGGDWAGKWELWQHFYAQAFLLSRDYGIASYGVFNEPNGFAGLTEADWLVRYRFCSDAIQSAVADMNARYTRSLVVQVFAANTANGAEKYNTLGSDDDTTDTWGRDAVVNRHLMLDGSTNPAWTNLHIYNYQKYTHRPYADAGLSGYIDDYNALRSYIDADTPGEPALPMALTEFNVRTGANYDTITATQDSPFDFSALGANCVALTERGASQLYFFKFGQTASPSFYGVAKNGTHYVENSSSSGYNYGGATKCAEVYRLFNKAAAGGKPRLNLSATAGAVPTINAGVWSLVTHDTASRTHHVFIANKETSGIPLDIDFSALPVPADNPVYVEEVSALASGGVIRSGNLVSGKLTSAILPAQAVWLVTVPADAMEAYAQAAVADTQLGDGTSKNATGGALTSMQVRADGTANGRRVTLVRIPVPEGNPPDIHSVLLDMDASTSPGGTDPVTVHVYGVEANSWSETSGTWSNSSSFLKQNIASGDLIANNVVAAQGNATAMLGQMVVCSPVLARQTLEVTEFVKSRTDGFASFMIVQNHRWDVAQPDLTAGDTQAAGIVIASRESASGGPRLVTWRIPIATGIAAVAREANIRGGTFAAADVDEAANGYLMVKYNSSLDSARKAYLQFDLPPAGINLNATATLNLTFNYTFSQRVQLWGLNVPYPDFSSTATWNGALANATDSNGMLATATAIGTEVTIDPGGALTPYSFTIPRLGDFVLGNKVTLVLTSVDHPTSSSGGLRIASGTATLHYGLLAANTVPTATPVPPQVLAEDHSAAAIPFSIDDAETLPENLTVSAATSDPLLLPQSNILPGGCGVSRTVQLTPTAGRSGQVTVTLTVSDGNLESSTSFVVTVTPDTPWTNWAQVKFAGNWPNQTISGPTADPDWDSIPNLMEYGLGGNPLAGATSILPQITRGASGLEFRFSRNAAATDLRISVESAAFLAGGWGEIAVSTGGNPMAATTGDVQVVESVGAIREVTVIDSRNPGATGGFRRLKVELIVP